MDEGEALAAVQHHAIELMHVLLVSRSAVQGFGRCGFYRLCETKLASNNLDPMFVPPSSISKVRTMR